MLIGAFSLSKKRRGPSGLLYGVRRIEERKYNDTVREAAYESTGISGFDRWGLDNLGFIPREFGKKNKPLTKAFSDAVQKEVPEHAFPLYFKSRVKAVDAPGDVTGYQDQDLGGGILKPIYGTKAAFEPIEGATRAEVQLAKKTNTSGPK